MELKTTSAQIPIVMPRIVRVVRSFRRESSRSKRIDGPPKGCACGCRDRVTGLGAAVVGQMTGSAYRPGLIDALDQLVERADDQVCHAIAILVQQAPRSASDPDCAHPGRGGRPHVVVDPV